MRTSARRLTVVGFDYVHSLVDGHSRLAYSEVQHTTTPQRSRRPPAHQPTATNVTAGYT